MTTLRSGDLTLSGDGGAQTVHFTVADGDSAVGRVDLVRAPQGGSTIRLSWSLPGLAGARLAGVIGLATEFAFEELGAVRVEAVVDEADETAGRAAARAALRREGVIRGHAVDEAGAARDAVLFARLRDDVGADSQESFTHVLNSTLPRKRLIAQGLVRDGSGRVLLCELTYKRFWDLPGGVVDPDEPPAFTVEREIGEELGIGSTASRLATVAWLPRWLGWDDATLLVFETKLDADLSEAVLLPREIKAIHWLSPDELEAHVAPYTVDVVRAALRALDEGTGAAYFEAGPRPT